MLARALCLSLLVLPLGCSLSTEPERDGASHLAPGSEVVFRTEQNRYSQGDTARIFLRNSTYQPIGYNLCSAGREFRIGNEWQRIESHRVCTMELRILDHAAEAARSEPITSEWQPGEYRMVTSVELMRSGTRHVIFTPPFTVTR